jgi:hypothetical protein
LRRHERANFFRALSIARRIGGAASAPTGSIVGERAVSPRNPANEALEPDVVEKLCKVFSLISSSNDGEKLAAVHALNRALEANSIDYHVLTARMAKPWLSDSAKEQFRSEVTNAHASGRAEALREIETRRGAEDVFVNTDGSDDWRKVAIYIDREKHRLPARDQTDWTREFIDDMATRARLDPNYEATPKQLVQLRKFFMRLGGKIT